MNLKSAMLSLLVVGVFALTVVTFIKNKPAKVVYVNMDELFNGFQMKKELFSFFSDFEIFVVFHHSDNYL